MASAISELYPAGCVVWYKYDGWPWWPSKVVEVVQEGDRDVITIQCFKTGDEYLLSDSVRSRNSLKSFVHEGVENLVIKAKKSCYQKKLVYADHCEALQQAVEYAREKTGNSEFSLGIDPYADVSTLSQKKATPNHSNKSRTPHTDSKVKRSSMRSSTKSQPKSASLTRNKKERNVDTTANSPTLADDPEHSSKDLKIESSRRKRSRDSLNTEGGERASAEVKRQRTSAEESEELSKKKQERGEGDKVVVPRKLDFSDERAVDGESAGDSIRKGSPHSIQTGPHDSTPRGPSTCEVRGSPDSSPVSRAELRPCSPCEGSLTNGLPSQLPSLDSVEGSRGESTMPAEEEKEEGKQRHREAEIGEAGGLPCSSKTRSEDGEEDVVSAEGSEGSGGGFSDSDDDSMPTFSCKVKEDLTLKQLQPNSIIWVKHSSKFPFWPALVVKVNKTRRTGGNAYMYIPRVLYFGYNETYTTSVRDKKKIAPFATKRTEEFMEEGRNSQYRTEFEQAVDEAKTCLEYRMRSDEATSTPRKLFDQVAKLRPKEYTKRIYKCPMRSSGTVDVGSVKERVEEALDEEGDQDDFLTGRHRQPFLLDNDEESNPDLDNSDDEEEDPVYSYDRVMGEVAELRSVLVDITQGKLASEFHRKMLEGSRKERNLLKVAPKAGPIAKWSTSKLTSLVEKLAEISKEASGGKLMISHAYDVLLPEFAVRVMMKFENLSKAEALMRLDHNVNTD